MNKKVLTITSLLALTCLVGCGDNTASGNANPEHIPSADVNEKVDNASTKYPEELLLNHRVVSIIVGEEMELKAIAQFGYDPANLVFEVKDSKIASINENGMVKGLKSGETEIYAKDKDNPDFGATVKVIVSAKINQEEANVIADGLKKINEDDEHFNKVVDFELYCKSKYRVDDSDPDNVKETLVSYDRYDQRMTISLNDAYFRILETDEEIKTENGASDFTNYEWVFYTNEFFDTYVYHQTGDVKNYYRAKTQSYMEKNRIDPLNDILDNLFVSGKEVLTNTMSSAKISRFSGALGSADTGTDRKIGSNGDGQVVFQYTSTFTDAADQDDESRYGIPFGTPLNYLQTVRYTVQNERVVASIIIQDVTYSIDGVKYHERYDIDHTYYEFTDESLYVPNRKEYTQVDTLFSV